MRTRQQIIHYLGLEMSADDVGKEGIAENEKSIKAAERIEQDFAKELADGTHGYGLHSDFVNNPSVLDEGKLVEVANYDNVVVYERRKQNEQA